MKIRVLENKLRIRITQSELKKLAKKEAVLSSIHFPGNGKLSYSLIPSTKESTTIQYIDHNIQIHLGMLDCESILDEQSVGVQSIHDTENGPLELLVEKDFTCLHPRGQDDADTFPNPNKEILS